MPARVYEGNLQQDVRQAIEGRLERWAAWSTDGVDVGVKSQLGRLSRSEPEYHSVCLVKASDEEAMQTEWDVNELPDDERRAVISEWLERGTISQKAKDCQCSIPTYYKRLDRAYERLYWAWHG